ncbi:MAG TPA: ABC transporter ATP-binding protein [Synergistaceae bacterium]|nr:ABC transporter ATP-binding protein [Synergistaceae bacterium]HPQ36356.1 ABC transporter ATP-binding protein [Synergistaceae bacterium]
MLFVEDLWFSFSPGRSVLRGISFSAGSGDCLCLLGPNGTGKTTLLKCVLGVLTLQRGRILLGGAELSSLSPRERGRRIAYVPQAGSTTFAYTVEELVLMGRIPYLAWGRAPEERDRKAARRALESLDLLSFAKRRFNELSGGERQLVLLARALAQNAPVLVLDEPTANLDYANQIRVLGALLELVKKNYAILMATHFPNHAFLAGTRVLLAKDGLLMAQGTPEEVITEERMSQLYRTPLRVLSSREKRCPGGEIRVCVPFMIS